MACFALIVFAAVVGAQPDFEHLYREALEQRERTLGKHAAKSRESARDLALYLALRGEYAKAAPYQDIAIELADTAEGATALHNWAVTLEESEPSGAEQMYRKALDIRIKALPAHDVELATTRLNLATLLVARGEAGASKLASTALAAFEKQLGPQDARTGAACGVLGAALATTGDIAAAERLFRRALTISEQAHGPTATQTASALENLADLLTQTGRELAARPLIDRAQQIRSRTR